MHTSQSCYWLRIRTLAVLTALGSILASPLATHAEPLFVATPQINGVPGTLWRLEDTNGDLDALDPGEKTIFRNIAGTGILTEDFVDAAASRSGTVYAVESDGRVLKLQDLNNDGDAQDAGEAQVFRDHTAQGFRLKSAFSIAVSQVSDLTTQQLRDVVYVSDPSLQATVKLEDTDGDGQAQGTEEICLYHESTEDKPLTAQRMTPDETGRLLAVDPNIQGILRLFDFNQDCTVIPPNREGCQPQLLSHEYFVVKHNGGVSTDLMSPFGIAVTSDDVMFVSDIPGSGERARILRLQDQTGDTEAQDSGEVTVFSNGTCQAIGAFSSPTALAVDERKALYVAEYKQGRILRLEDLNNDKNAGGPGECTVFAMGVASPTGLASQPTPLPPLVIALFSPDVQDWGKGPDFLFPPGPSKQLRGSIVDATTNLRQPGVKVACDVLAGCLQCHPKTVMTDSTGTFKFTVWRTSNIPPQGEETLAVSILGDVRFINVITQVP